jgi:hypothetical protein
MFRHFGYLKTGKTIETCEIRHGLRIHQSNRQKNSDLVLSALGGMLVIDEAHTFLPVGANNANAHDREALETLDALMEKHAGGVLGCPDRFPQGDRTAVAQHPGLKSRFSTVLSLPDYSTGNV